MNNIKATVKDYIKIDNPEGFIITGEDNLKILKLLPDNCIDNIYIDPPYNTGKKWSKNGWEFDDTFDSKWHFLLFLGERLVEAKRVMAEGASIFVHSDYRMNNEIKTYLMDPLFNEKESALSWCDVIGIMSDKIDEVIYKPISVPPVVIGKGPSICMDFFAGSHSYAAAAHKLGRRYISIELNESEQLFLDQIDGFTFGQLRTD
jgi:DNA modification methylase